MPDEAPRDEEDEPTCEICGEALDPTDELANLKLEEMHDERGWVWHFCCPDHLLAWVHGDPPQLEPYITKS